MTSILLNIFLFLLGIGIGVKYERWVRDKATGGGHSRFHETGFTESRYSRTSSFKPSTSKRPGPSGKKNSRFHIS